MNKIFCLETEWTQSVHDMKYASQVSPLLEFAKHCNEMLIPYAHRTIATRNEFDYYMQHLSSAAYKSFDMVYLCFHGLRGEILFATKEKYSLRELGENYQGVLSSRHIHFDSCLTLSADEDEICKFKKMTGARLVTGFMKSVPFAESFIFELWLIRTMQKLHPNASAKKIMERAKKEVPEYVKKLRFVAY